MNRGIKIRTEKTATQMLPNRGAKLCIAWIDDSMLRKGHEEQGHDLREIRLRALEATKIEQPLLRLLW